MNIQILQKYRDRIVELNTQINSDMEELHECLDEYQWQQEELGILLDENKTDKTYEDYYALEEVQKLIFQAVEHLGYIMNSSK